MKIQKTNHKFEGSQYYTLTKEIQKQKILTTGENPWQRLAILQVLYDLMF